ncbi:MAG TPA: hypothetical protein ENI88_02090 [Desulfobulbus sp.]|nr:hypothetical protein [Desulfobulbus sp.]
MSSGLGMQVRRSYDRNHPWYQGALFRGFVFAVLVCLALFQLWLAFFEQGIFTAPDQQSLLFRKQQDPGILVALAQAQRLHGELSAARDLYRKALKNNPYFLPAWLGLASLEADSGHVDKAVAIVRRLNSDGRATGWWRWDKALLEYQLGLMDILTRDLAYLVEYSPSNRKKAMDLGFALWPDPAELLRRMGSRNVLHLFRHALRKKNIDSAVFFWPLVEHSAELKPRERLRFIEQLRRNDRVEQAVAIWRQYFDSQSLLHNGDFSSPFLYRGFGWRCWRNGKLKGVHWRLEKKAGNEEQPSMHIWFDGSDNVQFAHLFQVVALQGGKEYLLMGSIRTKNLTTDQRPYFEVVGARCKAVPQRMDMVKPNQPWTPFILRFEVPDECRTMLVRLRRRPSISIDNRISGDLWIRNMKLEPVVSDSMKPFQASSVPGNSP